MPDGGMVNPVDSYKPDRFFVDGQDKAAGFAHHLMAGAGRVDAEGSGRHDAEFVPMAGIRSGLVAVDGTPYAGGQADVFEVTGIDRANRGAVG